MLSVTLLGVLAETLVVVEARVEGESAAPALADKIAAAVDAPARAALADRLRRSLFQEAEASSPERLALARRAVDEGCDAYRRGDDRAAISTLADIRDILRRRVDTVETEQARSEIRRAHLCLAFAARRLHGPDSAESVAAMQQALVALPQISQADLAWLHADFGADAANVVRAAQRRLPRPARIVVPLDPGHPAEVYCDGTTPITLGPLNPGHHIVRFRDDRGKDTLYLLDLDSGAHDLMLTPELRAILRVDEAGAALVYPTAKRREEALSAHAALVAQLAGAAAALFFYGDAEHKVHVTLVSERRGAPASTIVGDGDAPRAAACLRQGGTAPRCPRYGPR